MHSNESLFLDKNCAGVALFSGWLPSFRRESSDLRHTCPSLKQVFWLGVPKAGCSEVSLGILAGSNVQFRPNTYTVAGKSLNRFQQTLRGRQRAPPGRRQRIPVHLPLVARTTEVGEKQHDFAGRNSCRCCEPGSSNNGGMPARFPQKSDL
jgi:hypothetical protein